MLDHLWSWLLMGLLALLFNLTPILAPPTWAMLAYFNVQHDVPLVATALIGAAGATLGRVLLAIISRRIGLRIIPAQRREDVELATAHIQAQKKLSIPVLALFAVGPIPKSLLFMAAGIARIPLAPGALVYAFARSIIYFVALTAAGATVTSLNDIIASPVGGPALIAVQVISVVGTFLMFRIDLPRLLTRVRGLRMLRGRFAAMSASELS